MEISDLFSQDKNFHIEQNIKNSTINTAILILTDKEQVDNILNAIKWNK